MAISMILRAVIGTLSIVLVAVAPRALAQTGPASKSSERALSKVTPSRSASPLSDRTVVAQVNGKPIYKSDVDQAIVTLTRGRTVEPENLPQVQAAVLSQLINQRLLFDFIDEKNLAATPEEVNQALDAIKRDNPAIEQQVRKEGKTMAALRTELATRLSLLKFVQEYATPQRVESYFQRNKRDFDGTQLRVSHILLRPAAKGDEAEVAELLKQARRIKADIEAGKLNFADAAKQFSAGPSRHEGGDLGFINRDGPMVEDFSRTAFALAEGKVSEPVTTIFGIHLITVTDIKPGNKELSQVRDKLMPAIERWLLERLVENELKRARIELNDRFPHFKPGTQELVTPEK